MLAIYGLHALAVHTRRTLNFPHNFPAEVTVGIPDPSAVAQTPESVKVGIDFVLESEDGVAIAA